MKCKYKPEKDRIVLSMDREEARLAFALMGVCTIVPDEAAFVDKFEDQIRKGLREYRIHTGSEVQS